MSKSSYESKQKLKKGVKRICYVSEAALSVLTGVCGLLKPGAVLLGATIATPLIGMLKEFIDDSLVEPDLEEEYAVAVDNALKITKSHFSYSSSKLKLLEELSCYDDNIDMDLETVIRDTEAYQTQYMTKFDCQEILAVFDSVFRKEVVKHEKLSRYYTLKTGNTTLETLKRIHVILSADSMKLDKMYETLKETKDDTAQIKSEVHGIRGSIESLSTFIQNCCRFISNVLIQSMLVFFAFTVTTVYFDIHTENALTIYFVVLFSEILFYSPRNNILDWKVIISSVFKQAIFITACSLLVTMQYTDNQMWMFAYIAACALVGVVVKYALLYLKSNHKKNRNGYLQ